MNRFVSDRHKEFRTPRDVVNDLVEQATGERPGHLKRIARGYENEVYEVQLPHAGSIMVRIRRWGAMDFRQEVWAIEKCREAGLPVPEILLVDNLPSDRKQLQAMVQRKADGRPLSDVMRKLSKPGLDHILSRLGEILGRIHSIKVEGFGRRQSSGTWDYQSWEESTAATERQIASETAYLLHAGISEREVDFMLDMLRRYREEFPCRQPVLCHGDLDPDHVFVNQDLDITSVIDFGQFQGGSPMSDFIYMSFLKPELDLAPLKNAYPDRNLIESRFDRRLHLHRLTYLMACVAYITKIDNDEADKTPDAMGHLLRTVEILKREYRETPLVHPRA